MDDSKFSKKYRHVGYSYPGVGDGWVSIVRKAIIDIEKIMWPWWIPMFMKRWIHFLATGNSVVRVKYKWAYNLRNFLTKGQSITQIKDKFAELRIYGNFSEEIYSVIGRAVDECDKTCERCGSQHEVTYTTGSWIYLLCKSCSEKKS